MYNFKTRLLSLILSILMIVAIIPTSVATAASHELGGLDKDFKAGVTLDYDALHEKALIIGKWSTRTDLREGKSLTYTFRGTTYTKTYDASRHFANFEDAYEYWLSQHPGKKAAESTGVFIIDPGNTVSKELTVNFSAIILGSNAGIDPNNRAFTEQNVTTTTIKNGWAAAARKTEGVISNVIVSRTAEQENYVLQSTGSVQVIVDGFTINGSSTHVVNVKQGKTCAVQSDIHIQNSIMVGGSRTHLIFESNGSAYDNRFGFKNIRMEGTTHKGLYGTRACSVSVDGLYYANNGYALMGTNDSGTSNNQYVYSDVFRLHITNSYFYKCTAAEVMSPKIENGVPHTDVSYTIDNTMFYECGSSKWNMMEFNTTNPSYYYLYNGTDTARHHFNDNQFEFNFVHNTVVADDSVNPEPNYTVFEGNDGKQSATFALHVNENRFVGYRSIFPNVSGNKDVVNADFNNNYYAYTTKIFSGDTTGSGIKSNYCNVDAEPKTLDDDGKEINNPAYGTDPYQRYTYCYDQIKKKQSGWNSHQINYYMGNKSSYGYNLLEAYGKTYQSIYNTMYTDPYNYNKLTYYTDWNRIHLNNNGSTVFEIIGNNFLDKVNYYNIDYANKKIYIGINNGVTISSPKLYFLNNVNHGFYTNSGCTTTATSLTASNNSTKTYYMKAYTSSTAYIIYTVTVYATNPTKSYSAFTSYSGGYASGSALLYDPSITASSGTHTAMWDGNYYTFTIGTNAFATLDALFAKAGANPQIILTNGTYEAFTVKEPCSIYGYNGRYFASSGDESIYDWTYGPGWGTSHETVVKGITLGNMANTANFTFNLRGIRLTGQFVDTTRTVAGKVDIQNCIIDNKTVSTASTYYQFNVGNSSVKSAANTYYLKGVLFKNIGTDKNGQGVLFGGSMPTTFNMDYCHSTAPQLTKLFGSTWGISNVARKAHIWHCRIENIKGSTTLLTDLDTETANGSDSEILFRYTTVICDNYTGTLIDVSPFNYKTGNFITIDHSNFINRAGDATLLNLDYNSSNTAIDGYCVFNDNRVIGFMGGFTSENASAINSGRYLNAVSSYFAPYDPEYATAIDGICPTGDVVCASYYKDFAKTTAVDPMAGYSFKDDVVVDEDDYALSLTVDSDVTSVNFEKYIKNDKGFVISAIYADSREDANIAALPVNDNVTTVLLRVTNYHNRHVYREWTLYIKRTAPEGCGIYEITSDVGEVSYNEYTGVYDLTLPEDKSGATVSVKTEDAGATATVSGTISGLAKGETKDYTVTVKCGTNTKNYTLRVYRTAAVGLEISNYDYYAEHAAYIIDADWATPTDTVSFVFRGKTYTQPFDAYRHFASFADAYAHYEANRTKIIHDFPVFIFTAGTYSDSITVRYNAIILGTNAGITPNDPAMNAATMTPATTSVGTNSAWDTANQTIFTGVIMRTTRVDGGNSDLTYENAIVAEEKATGTKMRYNLVVDGVVVNTPSYFVQSQDIDVGSGGKGYRENNIYLQNFIANNCAGTLVWAQDTTYNYTTAHINNMRMTGGSAKFFQKYVDNFILNNSYFTGVTYGTGCIATDQIHPRHDVNFVFSNNVFATNSFTKFFIYSAPYAFGDFKKGNVSFVNNYFYDCATGTSYGLFRVVPEFEGMTYEFTGNLFYEPDYTINTLFDGNPKQFDYPYAMRFNRNRIIGPNIASFFPNMNSVSAATCSALKWDFSDNYIANTFTTVNDAIGEEPVYKTAPTTGVDPILNDNFTYFLDYNMTVRNNDLDIVSVSAGTAEVTNFKFEKGAVTALLAGDDVSGLVVSVRNKNATVKFYSDSACSAAASTTGLSNTKENVLYVRAEMNGFKGTAVKITLGKMNSSGLFTDTFVDPAGLIKSSAIMVDTSLTGNTGDIVTSTWNGVQYKFVYGTNAFNSLTSMYTYVKSKKPASIQVLIPTHTGSFSIQYPGEYFAPNYATSPFIKTNGEKAIDWDGVTDWKENPEYMNRSNLVYAKNLTVSGANAKGNITLYGFTYTGTHYEERTSTGTFNFKLVNTMKVGTDGDASFLFMYKNDKNIAGANFGNSTDTVTDNPSNNDSVTLQNYYLKQMNAGQRLFTESVPAHITFDGLWVDGHASNLNFQRCFPKTMSDNSSFTIKNSNLRNVYGEYNEEATCVFVFEPYDKAKIGNRTYKITYDNNIMYNYANYYGASNLTTDTSEGLKTFYLLRTYSHSISDIQITNNYVANPYALTTAIFHSTYIDTQKETRDDGSVVITGNTFNGVSSNHQINTGSSYACDKMVINSNYIIPVYNPDIATAGEVGAYSSATMGTVGENGYWLDYDRTQYSLDYDTYDIGGTDVEKVDHVYIYNTSMETKINLNNYISSNGKYYIRAFADEERLIERDPTAIYVPSSGAEVYLELKTSYDNTLKPKFITVHIVNSSEYYINNVFAGAIKDGTTHNILSWRGTLTATGDYAYAEGATFGGEGSGESFGVIYMASTDNLEAIKAALTAGKDNIAAAVASVNANATYSSSAQVHLITDQKTAWNEATQSISYLYKFRIKEGNKRATVMYTVYVDENGEKQILFSNIDVQTSTATQYAE